MQLNINEIELLNKLLQANIDRLEESVWDLDSEDCHDNAVEYSIIIQIM